MLNGQIICILIKKWLELKVKLVKQSEGTLIWLKLDGSLFTEDSDINSVSQKKNVDPFRKLTDSMNCNFSLSKCWCFFNFQRISVKLSHVHCHWYF